MTKSLIRNIESYYTDMGSGQAVVCLHGWGQNTEMMQFIQDYLSARFRVINLDFPGFGQSAEPDRSGQAVVCLHGWGQNTEMMQFIQDYLSARFRVINLDFPGFGQSAEPDRGYSVDDYALWLHDLLESLHVDNPILIGHSFGCRVALVYANQYPVPDRGYSVDDYALWLHDLLESLHVDNPILIGHSFGCRVALVYANQYPVKKMVLTGAAGIREPLSKEQVMKQKLYKMGKKLAPALAAKYAKKVGSS